MHTRPLVLAMPKQVYSQLPLCVYFSSAVELLPGEGDSAAVVAGL